jgi:pyridinium-3,5-biscarboxylic acid mononucleotide synthase
MSHADIRDVLTAVKEGRLDLDEASRQLEARFRFEPFEDLGFARVDHHRSLRQGHPEVILGLGKTPGQVAAIAERIVARGQTLLVTRADPTMFEAVAGSVPGATYHEQARAITCQVGSVLPGIGTVLVAAAGTSDLPVAEEACVTAEAMGNTVDRLFDVGVAGLHRLLSEHERLAAARVVVVVAGMEGALPSVVAGLVRVPVIAVPTSIGYGASFGGIAALLGMLNSCANSVSVVNIDNGFGAGCIASLINHLP